MAQPLTPTELMVRFTCRIGQMGMSYGRHNTLLAAVNQPPHLTAADGELQPYGSALRYQAIA